MGNDESRLVQRLNHIRHGEGLAGTGDAKQSLEIIKIWTNHPIFIRDIAYSAYHIKVDLSTQIQNICSFYLVEESSSSSLF